MELFTSRSRVHARPSRFTVCALIWSRGLKCPSLNVRPNASQLAPSCSFASAVLSTVVALAFAAASPPEGDFAQAASKANPPRSAAYRMFFSPRTVAADNAREPRLRAGIGVRAMNGLDLLQYVRRERERSAAQVRPELI